MEYDKLPKNLAEIIDAESWKERISSLRTFRLNACKAWHVHKSKSKHLFYLVIIKSLKHLKLIDK